MDESGCPVPDWIGFIRAARNSQEQNLEAVSDLPGGQVILFFLFFFKIPTQSHFVEFVNTSLFPHPDTSVNFILSALFLFV